MVPHLQGFHYYWRTNFPDFSSILFQFSSINFLFFHSIEADGYASIHYAIYLKKNQEQYQELYHSLINTIVKPYPANGNFVRNQQYWYKQQSDDILVGKAYP